MAIDDEDDDTRLYLGPSRSADILEVLTVVLDDCTELAIRPMKNASEVAANPARGLTMANKTHDRTAGGVPITDDLVAALAEKAEASYDVDEIMRRRGGRPPIGASAATVESVRLNPELRDALIERAHRDDETPSAVIRKALSKYLDVA
jgi:hypothetical protein